MAFLLSADLSGFGKNDDFVFQHLSNKLTEPD